MASIENQIIKLIEERAKEGEAKYGTTMDRDDLSVHQWLQHFLEELLDGAIYARKLQNELRDEYEETLLRNYDEEAVDDRMRVIGQNGNTGEHYDLVSGTEAAYVRSVYPGDATITEHRIAPCVAHSHWSHGFELGDTVVVGDENFRIAGISDGMMSLQFIEE